MRFSLCAAQLAHLQTIKSRRGGHIRFLFCFSPLSYQRFIYSLFLLPFVLAAGYTLPKSLLRGERRACQCQAVLGSFFALTRFVQGGGGDNDTKKLVCKSARAPTCLDAMGGGQS